MSDNQIDPTDRRVPSGHSEPAPGPPVPDDRVYGDDGPGAGAYGDSWLPRLGDTAGAVPPPPPPPAQAAAPRRRPSRSWLVAGLGAALLLAGAAAFASWGALSGGLWHSAETSGSYPQAISRLAFDGGSGDVEVRADASGPGVQVTRRLSWGPGSSQPQPNEGVTGSTLTIGSPDCSGLLRSCSIDYVVHVPAGTEVALQNGSGDVALSGALGTTVARTGSGDVAVTGGGDRLQVEAGSGDIEATGLTASQVIGHTGSGSMDLDFADAPSGVALDAGSGDISVRLPRGSYAVDVTTSSGDRSVDVTDDPASPDHVRVTTGSGDVEVAYR